MVSVNDLGISFLPLDVSEGTSPSVTGFHLFQFLMEDDLNFYCISKEEINKPNILQVCCLISSTNPLPYNQLLMFQDDGGERCDSVGMELIKAIVDSSNDQK